MDDLEGIGGLEIFNFEADWNTLPTMKKEIFVTENIYPGTIHSLDFYREPGKKINFKITSDSGELFSLLLFFSDMVGRLKKFWMPDRFNLFNIIEIFTDDKNRVRIQKIPNLYMHGHEILFIKMYNGDRITRPIESFSQEEEYTEFILPIALPVVEISQIELCSLIYLGRLDQDALEISYITDSIASADISFVELIEEYI